MSEPTSSDPTPREGPTKTAFGRRARAALHFEPGYSPAGEEAETQTLGNLELRGLTTFAELGPVLFSELVRDLETISAES